MSRSKLFAAKWTGGRGGTRTPDPLLAKQVLCQLSYTPIVEKTAFSLPVLSALQDRCILEIFPQCVTLPLPLLASRPLVSLRHS